MRKKISVLLCVLASLLCFTACGSKQQVDVEYDEATITQATEFLIDYCANVDEATMEQWKDMSDFSLEQQLTSAGLPFSGKSFLSAMDTWQAGVKECGEYKSHGDYTFEASKTEVKVATQAEFADREATISFIFDDKLYLESMTVDGQFSKGEILKKAGMNTILGMGTVFAVLIFISLIISLFRYIPALQNALTGKKQKGVQAVTASTANMPVTDVASAAPGENNSELIAVISAAIAAAEGTTTDDFVVRSIRRKPSNKWN